MDQRKKTALTMLVAGSIFSSLFMGVGIFFLNKAQELDERGIVTTGICIDNEYSPSEEGDGAYLPVVAFQTENGEKVEKCLNFGSNPPEYDIGESVNLIYLPEDPEGSVMLNSSFWMTTFPWTFLIIGLFSEAVFVFIFLWMMKKEKASKKLPTAAELKREQNDNPFHID